jgi:membrane-associated phospholipid phosphatase
LLAIQALLLLAMTATLATKIWQEHVWIGFGLAAVTVAVWAPEVRLRRERLWWFGYVAGIFIFEMLRSLADETAIPTLKTYPIDFDKALFFGHEPIQVMQRHLFDPDRVTPLDIFAVGMHWSFFFAPHLMAVLVYWKRREWFGRYVVMVVGTMYVGLILYFLTPTYPPWLAANHGHLSDVYRVMDFVGGKVDKGTYQSFYDSLGEPNSVAAMPSIHEGVTFTMYLWARDHGKRWAPWLLLYVALMGLALMYLAEHYLLDLIAGIGCALIAWFAARKLTPAPLEQPGS